MTFETLNLGDASQIWPFIVSHFRAIIEVITLVAEFAIAAVIYYEIEENRAASFLAEAHGKTAKRRAKIYDQFVDAPGASLQEKVESFNKLIKENGKLRDQCNEQLLKFAKFHHMLRFSFFHHDLMIRWFPQVLVRLWVILGKYLKDMEQHVGYWQRKPLMRSVLKSIEQLERSGCGSVTIYSRKSHVEVVIDETMIKQLKEDLQKELCQSFPD